MSDILKIDPTIYKRSALPAVKGNSVAEDRLTLVVSTMCSVVGTGIVVRESSAELVLSDVAVWDDAQYATAANRAGKDFYLYVIAGGGLLLSANATVPTGFTADTSRKIGGFHCECLSIGVISGHDGSGWLTGDIIPTSIWDLLHRSPGIQNGMAYVSPLQEWWMIYLQSNTGANTASTFAATITNSRNWMDFSDDLGAVGLRLPTDHGFQIAAEGSNQQTNIMGSADPVTTGGHVDTAGRRMVSKYFLEDCCGAVWQWLADQSYQNDATYAGTFGYYALPGGKGQLYRQGAVGDVKLLAGGYWVTGAACGSQYRSANRARWYTHTYLGARGCARSRES